MAKSISAAKPVKVFPSMTGARAPETIAALEQVPSDVLKARFEVMLGLMIKDASENF